MVEKILIVDNNTETRKLLKKIFSYDDFKCYEASSGETALKMISERRLHIIALAMELSGIMSGLDVIKVLRSNKKFYHIPIIAMSGVEKKSEYIIKAFNAGADDYITKPFNSKEFLARVKAVARRSRGTKVEKKILSLNDIFIDKDGRCVKACGQNIELRRKEFELLCILAEKKDTVLDREFLCETVLGYEYFGSSRVIDSHIKNLRKALGDKASMIKTVRGMGYKLSTIDQDKDSYISQMNQD